MRKFSKIIISALKEDRTAADITTISLIAEGKIVRAELIAKSDGIICGLELFGEVFKSIDKRCTVRAAAKDGQKIKKGKVVLGIRGPARAILSGERTALNFIQHLSGIATLTSKFVSETRGTQAKIYDTRKTLPGLRELEKYAVRCGGGHNHRMHLADMALIKDNHLKFVESIAEAVNKIRQKRSGIKIEVECENLRQVREAVGSNADILMLDNMDTRTLNKAISLIKNNDRAKKRPEIEISGGVYLGNVRKFAKLGVDRISVGALTHSAPALDLSLEIEENYGTIKHSVK